ncbi:nuclear GTPase SLIP-GC-like isoform X5 [Sander lucioperca]|uniref:nuclear GTPase SLIP-GC-like isoform X5 n=1 Tax=Sander lucioperca TaxID=283035 RepID=UPI00165391D1|nr:nuclear GTPase SLIP-GC-like isoform X5 [Sander lucioperca]
MDDFVRNKLTEWGFSDLIEKFKDEGIDTESLYDLGHEEIADLISKVGPRARFKKRLKLLKEEQNSTNLVPVNYPAQEEQNSTNLVPVNSPAQVFPSTSDTSDKGKRMLDFPGESSNWQSPTRKRRRDTYPEEAVLCDVKDIMSFVQQKIPNQDNKLNKFLKKKITDLETDKRELVGVFGKTGAGKSSLINAVIGAKNLLPSGSVSACTSVMIKVEANKQNQNYVADIEFITKEEWKDELWSSLNFLRDNADQENRQEEEDDFHDTEEKLSALYGEEWKNKSPENLMDNKYFKEIQEFLTSKKKTLSCESAKELSAKFMKYTRSDSKDGEGKRWYWPLVKCVTIKVPNNDLLQHVTLVDLPGNGDRNKSRDNMWKRLVGSCSAVWIVTDINRAAAEKEPWEILKSASSLMGNGGECQHIHFICTKSDVIEDLESDDHSPAAVRALIFKKNMQAKEQVRKEFSKLPEVKKHFNEECFQVFTVSSKEFLRKKCLDSDDTEIPKLRAFLQALNDCHSETLNYVSGAFGILSLIQGARCQEGADKRADVCKDLKEKMKHELDEVRKPMHKTLEAFEKCLSEGVEKSKGSCEKVLKSFLHPRNMKGGAFHKILKCVVENGGTYKPKKGKPMNLNAQLASCLTDSIDEEFKKTFPNEGKCGPFNGALNNFSLDTEKLIKKYKDVELQLIFLKTEVEKVKTKLNKLIRERKKTIYSSLMTTIEEIMQECYDKAAGFRGEGSLKNMRDTIEKHVRDAKNIMFERAKDEMMNQLRDLMEEILEKLKKTMQESIELSLNTYGDSIPDVTVELQMVKSHNNELKGSPKEEP